MLDFLESDSGWYLIAFALAVGVTLTMDFASRTSWVGVMVITAVFAAIAITHAAEAPGAVPLYVLTLSVGSVAARARRMARNPLLAGEPYWRRFLLTLVHPWRTREATEREEAS